MSEIRIDLIRPVTNRAGQKQGYITLREPTLGDLIECGQLTTYVVGKDLYEEVPNYKALDAYVGRLSRDIAPEVLKTEAHPADADRIIKALAPFFSGPAATLTGSSGSSSSGSA